MNDLGQGVKLCSALEEIAKKMNVSLEDVRGHVTSLEDQSERACRAHFEWQPPEVYVLYTYTSHNSNCFGRYLACSSSPVYTLPIRLHILLLV